MNTNKEELLNKIEELKDTINKVTNEINELKNQVELYEKQEKENKVWIPKNKEKYWTIHNDGCISQFAWVDDDVDNFKKSIGWVFKTKKKQKGKYLNYN